jgi:hypothetical protein
VTEISDIREGLATNLKTLNESRQVSAYQLENATPASLMVGNPGEIVKVAMGSYQIMIPVLGIAAAATEKGAQIRLDKWLSPTGSLSVWRAIESDKTLGGKVSNAIVLRCDGSQFITMKSGVEMLGSTWYVQIEL